MDRAQKTQVVEELKTALESSKSVIITHYKGLSVAEITDLRKNMRSLGANFRVTKNSLAKLAIKGTALESLSELLVGPTAIAFSDDEVAAAKGLVKFANDNEKLVIIGGYVGEQPIDIAGINSLSKLPSLDELRAKLISMINTPATRIAGVVQAPAGQLARVVGAYSQQGQ